MFYAGNACGRGAGNKNVLEPAIPSAQHDHDGDACGAAQDLREAARAHHDGEAQDCEGRRACRTPIRTLTIVECYVRMYAFVVHVYMPTYLLLLS